jgi:replicative DNA helicase
MGEYKRLTCGLKAVGKLIPANENPFNYITDTSKDWYLSVYNYNDDHKKLAEKKIKVQRVDKVTKESIEYERDKGVEGIEDVYTTSLVFDLDSKTDLDLAKKDCISVVERLNSVGISLDSLNISFSGGKGFSVVVEHETKLSPKEHESICETLAGDLECFDTSVYNPSRIFRLNHTKHNKTGLYKTPLSYNELKELSIEEIQQLAKQEYVFVPARKTQLPEKVINLKSKSKPEKPKEQSETVKLDVDFSKKPYYLSDLKYVLQCGYIPPGKGNEGMMILCSTYKHVGMDKVDAYHLLKSVNEKRSEIYGIEKRTKDEIWEQVITTVYSPAWRGGTYTKEQSELLDVIAKEFNIVEHNKVVTTKDMIKQFYTDMENISRNTIKTGIKELDREIRITPGMMIGLLAAPSAGKTSIATSIIEAQAKLGMNPGLLSMDMDRGMMTQRLIQRCAGINIEPKIRKIDKNDEFYDPNYDIKTDEDLVKAVNLFHEIYKPVSFDYTRGATLESIEEFIKTQKTMYGASFNLLVVDYLEKVRGPYTDATANSGYVASRLSDLAATYNIAIVLLLQPQKSAGDPSEPLLSMRKVKGASVIEQDCRIIMTMWRPGFDPQGVYNDSYASIAVVKNNMGRITQVDLGWDGAKGEVYPLSPEQRKRLKDLIEERKEQKEEQSGDW